MGNLPALDRPVTEYVTPAAFTLREEMTIDEALGALRAGRGGAGVGKIAALQGEAAGAREAVKQGPSPVAYFYILNEQEELVGVLPTRKLILAAGSARIAELMTRELITLGERETLFDAMEVFAMHRLLAVPVVDGRRRLLGIVELSLYTDEVFDLAHQRQLNEVFQLMGLRLEQRKQGGAWAGFRLRMPWLLANITGGLACAALGSIFEAVVAKVVMVALFIPLILTLAESVAVQSMTLAIEQAVMGHKVPGQLRREAGTAMLLGLCTGVLVGLVTLCWRGPLAATGTIGGSVAAAIVLAALLGRGVPKVIHWMKLNPRVASGPITLAVVDVVTITLYLSGATVVLGG